MPLRELHLSEFTIIVFACMGKKSVLQVLSDLWGPSPVEMRICVEVSYDQAKPSVNVVNTKLKCASASRCLMAMFMLHLKCAVRHNPEVVWIFSSRLQYMCVARPQTRRTSKMILKKQSPLLLLYTRDIFNCSILSRDCLYLAVLELMLSCSPLTLR